MDLSRSLTTGLALFQVATILARHAPKACGIILTAAHNVQAATTPAEELRAVLNGLDDAATEARSVLYELAPQQGKSDG